MKAKKTIILLLLGLLLFNTSCSDFLDKGPRDILSDPQVWSDPEAIKAYLANMYNSIQSEDFNNDYMAGSQAGFLSQLTDEAIRSYTWGAINNPIMPNDVSQWWKYDYIRTANEFIQKIETASIPDRDKNIFKAEARFIRAFHYFALVKRYGGVPIILEPQSISESLDKLQVPRNTEKEVYELIRIELDDIINNASLPESWDSQNEFRATLYAALALKSRAMLYAASIATYSFVDMGGIIGVPAEDKDFYWEESKKASGAIINSQKFKLYEGDADKVQNFQNLFLQKNLGDELIFVKAYSSADKGHSFDFYNAPQSFKIDYGCATNPTFRLVEDYEYKDGTKGTLRINDISGKPIEYGNPYDLFKDKDPRLLATVLLPFSPWQGGILEIRKGVIDGDKIIVSPNLTNTYGTVPNVITITGKDGPLATGDPTKSGFYLKKYMNPNQKVSAGKSNTNYIIFRLAEIYLNYAEAAVELNEDLDKALEYVNLIRDRAGIARLSTLDKEKVRHERKVELAFENHRWWDLIRWRISIDVMNNVQEKALCPYLVWEEGKKPDEMKYIFKMEDAPKSPRVFNSRLYYERINSNEILSNPKLIQNPGY